MTPLDGKAVVITGAGSGIGAEHAKLAARLGARVVICDIDQAGAQAVADDIARAGGEAIALVRDVTDPDTPEALVTACFDTFGTMTGLVNNAGILLPGKIETMSREDLVKSFQVNVMATAACAQAAIAAWRASGTGGSVVNTASGSHAGDIALGAYAATKGAVASLTYSWAMELRGSPIRMNAISPLAMTAMAKRNLDLMAEQSVSREVAYTTLPDPASNAPVACFLLSDAAATVNGQIVRIAGDELSFVTHPMIATPVLRGDWTYDNVAEAFAQTFNRAQKPLGLTFA